MDGKKRIADTLSITQLHRIFSTDDKCCEWLESARWGGKPVCPHCGGVERVSKSKSWHAYWRGPSLRLIPAP